MQTVWTQIRTDGEKVNFEKKASRRQQKHEKLPSRQSVKNASNHTQTRKQL